MLKAAIENPNRKKHGYGLVKMQGLRFSIILKIPKIPIFNLDKSKSLPISDNKVHQGAILKVSP